MLGTNPQNKIFYLVSLLAGVLLGGASVLYNIVEFSEEATLNIDPTNILSLIVTMILAIYVTDTINKTNEIERVEKDLLIKNLSEHKDNIHTEISKLVLAADLLLYTVNEKMKIIVQKTESFFSILKEANFAQDYESKNLMDVLKDFRILFTDTSADTTGTPPVRISENKITLSEIRKQELFQNLNKLDQEIYRLIRKINKSNS